MYDLWTEKILAINGLRPERGDEVLVSMSELRADNRSKVRTRKRLVVHSRPSKSNSILGRRRTKMSPRSTFLNFSVK